MMTDHISKGTVLLYCGSTEARKKLQLVCASSQLISDKNNVWSMTMKKNMLKAEKVCSSKLLGHDIKGGHTKQEETGLLCSVLHH